MLQKNRHLQIVSNSLQGPSNIRSRPHHCSSDGTTADIQTRHTAHSQEKSRAGEGDHAAQQSPNSPSTPTKSRRTEGEQRRTEGEQQHGEQRRTEGAWQRVNIARCNRSKGHTQDATRAPAKDVKQHTNANKHGSRRIFAADEPELADPKN